MPESQIESFSLTPIARVHSSRRDPIDDHWASQTATIELLPHLPEESLLGLDAFSHIEVVFLFHRVDPHKIQLAARHPRNNPLWPRVGIFAQRAKNRPNRLAVSTAQLLSIHQRTLTVAGLDAIDGTPILDIKPVLAEFLPQPPIRQPQWSHELMQHYWR